MKNKLQNLAIDLIYVIFVFFVFMSFALESLVPAIFAILALLFMAYLDVDTITLEETKKALFKRWFQNIVIVAVSFVPMLVVLLLLADFTAKIIRPYVTMGEAGVYVLFGGGTLIAIIIIIEKIITLIIGLVIKKIQSDEEKEADSIELDTPDEI